MREFRELFGRQPDYSIVLTNNTSDFTTSLYPPLNFHYGKWTVGLVSIDTAYSFANITSVNNIFTYSVDNGTTWKTITLPVGCYEITTINDVIKDYMLQNGDTGIEITPNYVTLGCNVTITPGTHRVDFNIVNSIGPTLGFDPITLSTGINTSQHIAKISSVNSILVNCSIVGNSYLKGTNTPVLFSFFPNVAPGRKITKEPVNPVYLPLNTTQISNIRIWLTDQDGNPLDFRGEEITVRLNFKHI